MRGRIYAPKSPWASAAEGFASGYIGSQADAEEADERKQLQTIRTPCCSVCLAINRTLHAWP